jgi:hypothetical protein
MRGGEDATTTATFSNLAFMRHPSVVIARFKPGSSRVTMGGVTPTYQRHCERSEASFFLCAAKLIASLRSQ